MISPDHFLAFVITAVVIIVVPGPSVLFTIGRSLALGRRAGVLSVIGNALGILPAIGAVAIGLGALVAASVVAFTIVKLVGAAYLIHLGVQAFRHRHDHTAAAVTGPTSSGRLLWQGFVVGVTNPKTLAFFVAVLPQFVDPAAGPVGAQLLMLGLTFAGLALVCDSVWAMAAGTARGWFGRSPRRLPTLSGAGGVMMIGLGGTLAFAGSKAA